MKKKTCGEGSFEAPCAKFRNRFFSACCSDCYCPLSKFLGSPCSFRKHSALSLRIAGRNVSEEIICKGELYVHVYYRLKPILLNPWNAGLGVSTQICRKFCVARCRNVGCHQVVANFVARNMLLHAPTLSKKVYLQLTTANTTTSLHRMPFSPKRFE